MPKALLVVHQRYSYPGRLAWMLMARGYTLDVRCPNLGQALPQCLDDYGVCLMFGGPMSANDAHLDGIRTELDWLPRVLEAQVPFLGICLGAQLLARAVGGRVAPHPEGMTEIGYTRIEPTEAGRAYFDGPMTVYQWHREGFELPPEAVLLARGEVFRNQAFRWGDCAYGVQFHPEVTLDMKQRWTTFASRLLTSPGAQPAERHLGEHPIHDPPLAAWAERFFDRLLEKKAPASPA